MRTALLALLVPCALMLMVTGCAPRDMDPTRPVSQSGGTSTPAESPKPMSGLPTQVEPIGGQLSWGQYLQDGTFQQVSYEPGLALHEEFFGPAKLTAKRAANGPFEAVDSVRFELDLLAYKIVTNLVRCVDQKITWSTIRTEFPDTPLAIVTCDDSDSDNDGTPACLNSGVPAIFNGKLVKLEAKFAGETDFEPIAGIKLE